MPHRSGKKQMPLCYLLHGFLNRQGMWCEMFSFLHADNYSIVPLKGINNLFKGSVEFRIVAP